MISRKILTKNIRIWRHFLWHFTLAMTSSEWLNSESKHKASKIISLENSSVFWKFLSFWNFCSLFVLFTARSFWFTVFVLMIEKLRKTKQKIHFTQVTFVYGLAFTLVNTSFICLLNRFYSESRNLSPERSKQKQYFHFRISISKIQDEIAINFEVDKVKWNWPQEIRLVKIFRKSVIIQVHVNP